MRLRITEKQQELWIETESVAKAPGHVFFERQNGPLAEAGFDGFAQDRAEPYYASSGRPGIPPGVYFRMLCCRPQFRKATHQTLRHPHRWTNKLGEVKPAVLAIVVAHSRRRANRCNGTAASAWTGVSLTCARQAMIAERDFAANLARRRPFRLRSKHFTPSSASFRDRGTLRLHPLDSSRQTTPSQCQNS